MDSTANLSTGTRSKLMTQALQTECISIVDMSARPVNSEGPRHYPWRRVRGFFDRSSAPPCQPTTNQYPTSFWCMNGHRHPDPPSLIYITNTSPATRPGRPNDLVTRNACRRSIKTLCGYQIAPSLLANETFQGLGIILCIGYWSPSYGSMANQQHTGLLLIFIAWMQCHPSGPPPWPDREAPSAGSSQMDFWESPPGTRRLQ